MAVVGAFGSTRELGECLDRRGIRFGEREAEAAGEDARDARPHGERLPRPAELGYESNDDGVAAPERLTVEDHAAAVGTVHGDEQAADTEVTYLTGTAFAVISTDLGREPKRVTNVPTTIIGLQIVS
ncbi:MAG: hypothetical protein R3286_02485 [Gammaproteobacteria bacterium]|nr:hypothetical protein [Gammaproteobacteria bacterium]